MISDISINVLTYIPNKVLLCLGGTGVYFIVYNTAGKEDFLCNEGHANKFYKHPTVHCAALYCSVVDSALQNLLFPMEIKKVLLSYIKI